MKVREKLALELDEQREFTQKVELELQTEYTLRVDLEHQLERAKGQIEALNSRIHEMQEILRTIDQRLASAIITNHVMKTKLSQTQDMAVNALFIKDLEN